MKNKLFKVKECYLPQTLTLFSFHTSLNKKKRWMWHLHFKVVFILYSREREKELAWKVNRHIFVSDVGERACVHLYVWKKRTEMSRFFRDSKWKACQIFLLTQTLISLFSPSLSLLQCASICVLAEQHLWQQNSTNLRFITMPSPSLTHLS